ncbi:MAG: four helix bundle protein [Patescibacteria group bacterium]|nr:four helix bundle protein [Patescibacteria group bacterium]
MDQAPNSKAYSLEERTFKFALQCRDLIKTLPRTITNIEYAKQLARSSGSVAANYIEANESLSKKDFFLRMKICRKEVKESRLWLSLLGIEDQNLNRIKDILIGESTELLKIFSSIIKSSGA